MELTQEFHKWLSSYILDTYPLTWPHREQVEGAPLCAFSHMVLLTRSMLYLQDIHPTFLPLSYTHPHPQPWPEAHYDLMCIWHITTNMQPPIIILKDKTTFTYTLALTPSSPLVLEWTRRLSYARRGVRVR